MTYQRRGYQPPQQTQQAAPPSNNGSKKLPAHSFRYPVHEGNISFPIWDKEVQTQGGNRIVFSVSFERSYHDGKGWQNTTSLRDMDIPVLVIGLQECWRKIMEMKGEMDRDPGQES